MTANIVASDKRIPSMSIAAIDKVRKFEAAVMQLPQVDIETDHVIHGGMYARSIKLQAGVMLAGALIKVPTTLIINGHVRVFMDDQSVDLCGYNILAASAGRKQAFLAFEDTNMTMIFASNAQTIEQAEQEFTDEADMLISRRSTSINTITITGE